MSDRASSAVRVNASSIKLRGAKQRKAFFSRIMYEAKWVRFINYCHTGKFDG